MTTENTDRRRWLALYVLCAGVLMIVLDATIVNVALPSIQDDLGFSQENLAWVVNAYLIAFGGLLLLAGRLGDLIGHRRVFLAGLVVFTVASVSAPPASSPIDAPAAATKLKIPMARACSAGCGNIVTIIPRITAEVIAPPTPWTKRAPTRIS